MSPTLMLKPLNLPKDAAKIHPWIGGLLGENIAFVASAIHQRLSASLSRETLPLARLFTDFRPRRIEFTDGIGYVQCVTHAAGGKPSRTFTDQLYIAEPLPERVIKNRIKYYDQATRPLMKDFLSKYAGCGENMEGCCAGQFVMHDCVASEVAYYEPEKLGQWRNSRLIYSAYNGDSIFVNERGATAWHVLETNELVPLFESFPSLVNHYANVRSPRKLFDSWTSRDLLGRDPWK